MFTVRGNDIYSGGDKVGWIEGDDIYDERGMKVGYFHESNDDVFDRSGKKIGYLEGGYLKTIDGRTIAFSALKSEVKGGSYPVVARAAVYLLL